MSKRIFKGQAGESEMSNILQATRNTSSSTCNSSLGFFQDVFQQDGKFFSAVVPNALNGGGENFFGTIEEISSDKAHKLMFS